MSTHRTTALIISVSFILILGAGLANASDKITIRYLSGYPPPSISSESILFEIDRSAPSTITKEVDVDRFFTKVQSILSSYHITKDWALVPPDAPSIRITIDLNGQRYELASSHTLLEKNQEVVFTENALEPLNGRNRSTVLSKQSEQHRQHRTAFEALLKLSMEYINARLSN